MGKNVKLNITVDEANIELCLSCMSHIKIIEDGSIDISPVNYINADEIFILADIMSRLKL